MPRRLFCETSWRTTLVGVEGSAEVEAPAARRRFDVEDGGSLGVVIGEEEFGRDVALNLGICED